MRTLLLDRATWNLCVDINGNIAVCDGPYAAAQDAASYIRTFLGECWYDTTLGVPYFTQILGMFPPLSLVKSAFVAAALQVPGVVTAKAYVTSLTYSSRKLLGQVQITTTAGASYNYFANTYPAKPPVLTPAGAALPTLSILNASVA